MVAREPAEFVRTDVWIAVAVVGVAACVFASAFSSHVALGDAPESVAGVKTLGILHAPGYPSYVVAAHVFGDVFRVGSWAFRVNVFSVVCAALMVGALFLLARCFGASRVGASIGALVVGLSASVWFNAGFAKHYAFSGMLVAFGALLVMLWVLLDHSWLLLASAVVVGVGFGAAWEVALIEVISVAVLFIAGSRRPNRGLAFSSVMVLGVVAAASYLFVFVRAGQHPTLNWGEASTVPRLLALITHRDFRGSFGSTLRSSGAVLPIRIASYGPIVARDIGVAAAALAIAGGVIAWQRFERGWKLFLAALAILNLVAVITAAGIDHIQGLLTSVIAGGYLLDVMVVLAVLISVAFTPVARAASNAVAEVTTRARYRSQVPAKAAAIYPVVVAVMVVVLLAPSLVFHYRTASHRMPPLADRYGSRLLEELPRNSVLFVFQPDFGFPVTYRQTVEGQRRDVSVAELSLGFAWYPDHLARELHMAIPATGSVEHRLVALIDELRRSGRPVFLDMWTTLLLQHQVGHQAHGLVAEVVSGTGPQPIPDRAAASARLQTIDRDDGVTSERYARFPNGAVLLFHERAHIELAKANLLVDDTQGLLTELRRALQLIHQDSKVNVLIKFVQQHGRAGVRSIILDM